MYLGDNLLRDGITRPRRGLPQLEPGRADPADPGRRSRRLRRRRARGERRAAGREAEGPAQRPRAGRRLHVHAAIFDAAHSIKPSGRGELEITDAIEHLIDTDRGSSSTSSTAGGRTPGSSRTCSKPTAWCSRTSSSGSTARWTDSRVEGRVAIEKGCELERTVVRGPAIIGARRPHHRRLRRALHGDRPDVADHRLGDRALDRARGLEIRDLHARMEASLLGKNVSLTRSEGMPKTLQFLVGDNAEISIPSGRARGHGRRRACWARRGQCRAGHASTR